MPYYSKDRIKTYIIKQHIRLTSIFTFSIFVYSIVAFINKSYLFGTINLISVLISLIAIYFLFYKRKLQSISRVTLYLISNSLLYLYSGILGIESGFFFFFTIMLLVGLIDSIDSSKVEISINIIITTTFLLMTFLAPFPKELFQFEIKLPKGLFIFNLLLSTCLTIFILTRSIFILKNYISELKKLLIIEQKLVTQKDSLIQEINHRVKNNLSIILALIRLKKSEIETASDKEIIHEIMDRIYAMSNVHELVYNNDLEDKNLVLETYINNLAKNISSSLSEKNQLELVIELNSKIELGIEKAIPLGLVINEMITNSIKHATEDKVHININTYSSSKSKNILKYSDNNRLNKEKTTDGTGLMLIETLLNQIDFDYTMSKENGFIYQITLKE